MATTKKKSVKTLNLYHVSQDVNTGYDTYSDFVCAAENESDAARMRPHDAGDGAREGVDYVRYWSDEHLTFICAYKSTGKVYYIPDENSAEKGGSWAAPEDCKVVLIGKAAKGMKPGPICASFHAG